MPVSTDERHVAMPKLYGAPATYRRPGVIVQERPHQPTPDDLPLVAYQTDEERQLLEGPYDPSPTQPAVSAARRGGIRALASRFFGP